MPSRSPSRTFFLGRPVTWHTGRVSPYGVATVHDDGRITVARFATAEGAAKEFYGYTWRRRRGRSIEVRGRGDFLVGLEGDTWKVAESRKGARRRYA